MIGELYEHALAGWARPEIEHADGSRKPLPVDGWLHESPGDKSILDRCEGPTLDIGSGPGRLTVALSERGIPALGIDITPYAVDLARSSGALVMLRDVFGRVPGTGRWTTALLADGNIGIGGDPAELVAQHDQRARGAGQVDRVRSDVDAEGRDAAFGQRDGQPARARADVEGRALAPVQDRLVARALVQPPFHRKWLAASVSVLDLRPRPAGQRVLVEFPDHADLLRG